MGRLTPVRPWSNIRDIMAKLIIIQFGVKVMPLGGLPNTRFYFPLSSWLPYRTFWWVLNKFRLANNRFSTKSSGQPIVNRDWIQTATIYEDINNWAKHMEVVIYIIFCGALFWGVQTCLRYKSLSFIKEVWIQTASETIKIVYTLHIHQHHLPLFGFQT